MIEKTLNPHRKEGTPGRGVHYCIVTERTDTHIHIINPFGRNEVYTTEESIKRIQLSGSPYISFLEKVGLRLGVLSPCTIIFSVQQKK